ncbi:wall-associated receptor kinase-like 9 [Gossypium hirsutum]|uniref:Wall-associated receptor kinase-like 9 n=1 Tax=Gossypium hirsutum TaxID=3635 RepID=A0ABM3AMK4_GOSHI|nr:wall-associated receptor kinase-like 9 [Gossypium hirsutum]
MGFHLPLYLILLLLFMLCPILQAAESQEPACGKEACGNITIPSPFGIHSTCCTEPWFRVTCNPTLNGVKPFINVNGIDLEVLGKALYSNAILINNPVTYINCDSINKVSGRVNLLGTPFFFSSKRNYFGSVGCGNSATILSNEAVSLGGCIQPRCDDDASESGCFTQITANLTSYTVNMTAMYPDSKRCASAFIFSKYSFRSAYPLPTGINNGTTQVPAVLNWNSTYCDDGVCGRPGLGPINVNTDKVWYCGNVTFHYPFRMKDQDYETDDWFEVAGLSSFYINMSNRVDSSDYRKKKSCGFASLISDDYDLEDSDISSRTHVPTQLQWGTPLIGECYLNDSSNISCTSDGEYCWSRLSSTHLCACDRDIRIYSTLCKDGNCGDYQYCSMLCLNTPTNYCSSESCPPNHYEYNSTGFRCERKKQTQNTHDLTSIIIGCSTSIGTLFLLLATWSVYKVLKRKQKIMLKQKYFKRNGGLLLQQHLSSNEGNVEKIKLFTSKEMEKATDHYNENRILGQGGQGTVYKGMLIDGSIVAIKKSKMVEGKKFDEKKERG